MIGYFRKIKLQYYLGGIIGILVLFFLFITVTDAEGHVRALLPFGINLGNPTLQGGVPLVLMALWVVAWRYYCGIRARKELYTIMDILLMNCDPQGFLKVLTPLLPKKPKYKGAKIYLYLLYSTGLMEAGQYDEAKKVLDGFDKFPKNPTGSGYKFTYYNNRFRYYHHLKDWEECSANLARMKEVLSKEQISRQMYRVYDNIYDQKRALYKLETGDWSEAEEVYRRMLQNSRHQIDQITARLVLGRVCQHDGRIEEAKEYFEYAIGHGGQTQEALEAKALLEQISN